MGWDVCNGFSNPLYCPAGSTFSVPSFNIIQLGFCSACNPPQFPQGTVTIGNNTHNDVYFYGTFNFPPVNFLVPTMFMTKKRGTVRHRKPFTMTGSLRVCSTPACPDQDVIYEGMVTGHGTLTITSGVGIALWENPHYTFLKNQMIVYQFEE